MINQEQLIQMLAETQARLEALELENRRLRDGMEITNNQLSEEVALRINAERRAEDSESKNRQEYEREKAKQELERKRERADYAVSLDVRDQTGSSQLHHACREQNFSEINRLIRDGAKVNAVNKEGQTPLDWADKQVLPSSNMLAVRQSLAEQQRVERAQAIVALMISYGGSRDQRPGTIARKYTLSAEEAQTVKLMKLK